MLKTRTLAQSQSTLAILWGIGIVPAFVIVFGNAMSSQPPHLAFSNTALDWLKMMLAPVGALVLGPAITNLAPNIKDYFQ